MLFSLLRRLCEKLVPTSFSLAPVHICSDPNHLQQKHAYDGTELIYWVCEYCRKTYCHRCSGCADALPEACDDCWFTVFGSTNEQEERQVATGTGDPTT
jgi:hypothetical protein